MVLIVKKLNPEMYEWLIMLNPFFYTILIFHDDKCFWIYIY